MKRWTVNAGKYRNPITIQQKADTNGTLGKVAGDWTDFLTCRAAIYPTGGHELSGGQFLQTEITHKINMRYYPGINAKMRVKYGERVLLIQSVINFQEQNSELQLLCKELN